jgi:hypothetical protein
LSPTEFNAVGSRPSRVRRSRSRVGLLERFSKQSDPLKTLVRRVLRTENGQERLAERHKMTDLRGPDPGKGTKIFKTFCPVRSVKRWSRTTCPGWL